MADAQVNRTGPRHALLSMACPTNLALAAAYELFRFWRWQPLERLAPTTAGVARLTAGKKSKLSPASQK